MDVGYFIAKRLSLGKESKRYVSRSIVRFASLSIALGLSVMIITVAVVTGFKNKISYKVFGFGSHIQVVNFDSNSSYETMPITKNEKMAKEIAAIHDVKHVQPFATKPGIIKTQSEIQGIVMKGVDKDFDWSFFQENLVAGKIFKITDSTTNNILISKYIASLLKLKPGDDIAMYFVQEPPRMRRLTIAGIYETGLEEFDKIFVISDIKHIQKLNNWKPVEITGYEIAVTNFKKIDAVHREIRDKVGLKLNPDGSGLKVTNIKEKNPQIFDWINLQNMNVWIILALMLVVAGFNMVSGLLILILERTNMIGLLKSLGANNHLIANIFFYQSGFLILKGLIWGNIIGISICLLQYHFQFIKLDQSSYFLNSVPINLNILNIILLNIGTAVLTFIMLTIPSLIISKVTPESTLRFN
ncbi:MAG TPA: FtsX-like permease family protein [Bacteroidales bacterium]|nr:FtsX-like permease family protein [Bacteroidales bacterium]